MQCGIGEMGYRFSSVSANLGWQALVGQTKAQSFDIQKFQTDLLELCISLRDAAALVGFGEPGRRQNQQSSIPNHVRRYLMANSKAVDSAFNNIDNLTDGLQPYADKPSLSSDDLADIESKLNTISLRLQSYEL